MKIFYLQVFWKNLVILGQVKQRVAIDEYLKGRNLEMIYSTSVYITDLRKMLSNSFGNLNSICYVYEKNENTIVSHQGSYTISIC